MDSKERIAIRRALDELKPYLAAFVVQHARTRLGSRDPDIQALLRTMLDNWEKTFRGLMPPVARSYVHELLDIRNRWAHEASFSKTETNRAIDTVSQLAAIIGAPRRGSEPGVRVGVPARTRSPAMPVRGTVGQKLPSQRDMMRDLYKRSKGDPGRVIREYAVAEQKRLVRRKANKSGLSPEEYARALFADGMKKGWLG